MNNHNHNQFLKSLTKELPKIRWSPESLAILREIYNKGIELSTNKNTYGISPETQWFTNHFKLPKGGSFTYMPQEIQKYIEDSQQSSYYAKHIFDTGSKQVIIHLIQPLPTVSLEQWKKEVMPSLNAIENWLRLASIYSCKECSKKLEIFMYWTPFEKELPADSNQVIDTIHANTAYTTSCMPETEIYIFRKEEWYKVLIHETFHCFGFDFSASSQQDINREILRLFPIRLSDPRIYESYCEMWAEIMVHFMQPILNRVDWEQTMRHTTRELEKERAYSLYQMTKILDRMGLDYDDLFSKEDVAIQKRTTRYKEKTSVFSYYILKSILMFYVDDFLSWCKKPFQFDETRKIEYVSGLIGERYNREEYVLATHRIHDMSCSGGPKRSTGTKRLKCVAIPKKYKHTLRMTAGHKR